MSLYLDFFFNDTATTEIYTLSLHERSSDLSGAQIGANVHLAGGVGIGGVLEPPGARPVIVEDGAFIGSRCIIVEGVRVGREAVPAPNVTLPASVPIIDVTGDEPVEHRG